MSVRNYKQIVLTLETRVKVIQDSEKGISQRDLAKKYKCGKTQIQKILKSKDDITTKWTRNVNRHAKRNAFQRYAEVNRLTLAWYERARTKGVPINGPILQQKAKDFANSLNKDGFSASNGWLQCFCKRNNIVFRNIDLLTNSDNNQSTFDGDSEDWEKDLTDEAIRNRDGETSLTTNTELDQSNEENIECIPLSEALKGVDELKKLAYWLGNNKLVNLLYDVETEFEREVVLRTASGAQKGKNRHK